MQRRWVLTLRALLCRGARITISGLAAATASPPSASASPSFSAGGFGVPRDRAWNAILTFVFGLAAHEEGKVPAAFANHP
jgi:hypothetical protein